MNIRLWEQYLIYRFNSFPKEQKVIQYQISLYSGNFKGKFLLLFDTAVADALELGALCREKYTLNDAQYARITALTPKNVTANLKNAVDWMA